MMSGVPLETCWAFTKLWNNKLYYKAASCWYFYWVIYDARIHEYQLSNIQNWSSWMSTVFFWKPYVVVYTSFFFPETLRKYPPVQVLLRICTNPYRLPGTDVDLEKGIQIFIPVMGLHYDPKYYPQPERFDPERFSDKEKKNRPQYSYLPFGEGPRICIGEWVAFRSVKEFSLGGYLLT